MSEFAADKLKQVADEAAVLVAFHGPHPCRALASALHRRKAVVLAAFDADPRFEHTGEKRGSLWRLREAAFEATGTFETPAGGAVRASTSTRVFSVRELVSLVSRRTGEQIPLAQALVIIEGKDGFLERGLVARVGPGRFIVTEAGLDCSRALHVNGSELAG